MFRYITGGSREVEWRQRMHNFVVGRLDLGEASIFPGLFLPNILEKLA